MNTGEDEPSSGLNGRLRPRKSITVPSPRSTKALRKTDGRTSQEKPKRTSTPSKTQPNKPDDLATKSDSTFTLQFLCPCCDREFASKQALNKHVRRMHVSSSKQDFFISCLFCKHNEAEANDIIGHMVNSHPLQYFACQNCHTRFSADTELNNHKLNVCEKQKPQSYRSKLRQNRTAGVPKKTQKNTVIANKDLVSDSKVFPDGHGFNGVVISCELKPSQVQEGADIEDNITTNLILPPSKNLGNNTVIEKNAVIVLDDIQWNKRIPPNFSFHNTDADQILSRLGVVHRSPRTGESSKRDWKTIDDSTQKFEKCFDTSFYSKVASNVQENLTKFLDGSFNFNPDPDSTIKTRKSKNSVVINTAEGFPILLASEQYSRNAFDRYMPRAIAPKHKWKWDNLETDRSPINQDQIKRDTHTNNCIITLVSSLDIWTQLRMRRKYEEKFGFPPVEKKTEKQNIISNELKEILESRELPPASSQVVQYVNTPSSSRAEVDFPASLGLAPSTSQYEMQPAVLSGEWVRPRCYVCCACGAQSRDSRAVSLHISTQHPNAQIQHYEIVGEQLLNADILKHLYVPPSQMPNRTRPLRGFRECTKCKKSITLEDLHQHMLDCAGDTPAVRRKCRYRPFGVRRRRPRLPDNTIRKKMRKDIRTRQTRPKTHMRPRPIRTEVGDAETIRKMLADLPAKRHRVVINPNNPTLRPRKKQRTKLIMKRRSSEDRNNRKKRSYKESNETQASTSALDKRSTKGDDDNKPLKPKVKRMPTKASSRTETLKRKATAVSRPKRNVQLRQQGKTSDGSKDLIDSDLNSKGVMTDELSIDESPRIDINNASFNTHQRAGQANSSNRDGQRPGCSWQNANPQNRRAPVQNAPLKHSIARLTADSEKHDKSVQFHHLFLVQQECNNGNQHLHAEQQQLFENEAAVITLDKPPLQYNTKGSSDLYALQKNKSNKPRKGLSACIAMLKNKLVEPCADATPPPGYASVQCGDDEPLDMEPIGIRQVPSLEKHFNHAYTFNLNTPLVPEADNVPKNDKGNLDSNAKHEIQSVSSSDELHHGRKSQNSGGKRDSTRRSSQVKQPKQKEITLDVTPKKVLSESIQYKEETKLSTKSPHPGFSSQKQQNEIKQKIMESNSRKTHVNSSLQMVQSESTEQKLQINTNSVKLQTSNKVQTEQSLQNEGMKSIPKKMQIALTQQNVQPESILAKKYDDVSPQKVPVENISRNVYPESISRQKHTDFFPHIECVDPNSERVLTEVNPQPVSKDMITHKAQTLSVSSKALSKSTMMEGPPDPIEKRAIEEVTRTKKPIVSGNKPVTIKEPSITVLKHPGLERTFDPRQNNESNTFNLKKSDEPHACQGVVPNRPFDLTIHENVVQGKKNTSLTLNELYVSKPGHSNDYYEGSATLPSQGEFYTDCEYSRRISTENYSSNEYNTMPVNIPPAHASTNVESIVSVPLDLSGKTQSMNVAPVSQLHESTYASSYDSYETLDLSNKSLEAGRNLPPNQSSLNDDVVDLRVKPAQLSSSAVDASSTIHSGCENVVTDLSLKTRGHPDIPTDLTVKRKDTNEPYILSKSKKETRDGAHITSYNKETVTKNIKNVFSSIVTSECANELLDLKGECAMAQKSESREINIVERSTNATADPRKKGTEITAEVVQTSTLIPILESTAKKVEEEVKKSDEISLILPEAIANSTTPVTKPVYDPTLKIPQYKIRATSGGTIDVTVISDSNPLKTNLPSTCAPITNYSLTSAVPSQDLLAKIPASTSSSLVKERLPFSLSSICSNSPINPNAPLSKIESTTPVYTLANACISVTKIETSISSTLTKTLLSVSGNTIANSTPVYTLTGTTIGAPSHASPYSHIVSNTPTEIDKAYANQNSECDVITSGIRSVESKEKNTKGENTNKMQSLLGAESDPETARKIAMLPKELVEILGNMPVENRNQLLNVLPQYVSTSTTTPLSQCELRNNESTGMATESIDSNKTGLIELKEPELNIIHTSDPNNQKDSFNLGNHVPQNKPIEHLVNHPLTSNTEYKMELVNVDSNVENKFKDSYASSIPSIISLCREYDNSTNKIIDLTEDEIIPHADNSKESSAVLPSVPLLGQPKRQKTNNDQTASLRAVRIKAPSERQKSIENQHQSIIKSVQSKTNEISSDQEGDFNKSLHINTDKSLAIQQAEVSSTQHNNKNVTIDNKFPLAISPNIAQELSVDRIDNCKVRRLSTPTQEILTKISQSQNVPLNSTVKTTLVTSSILTNEIIPDTITTDKTVTMIGDAQKSIHKYDVVSRSDITETIKDNLSSDRNDAELLESDIIAIPDQRSKQCLKSSPDKEQKRSSIILNNDTIKASTEQEDSDDDLSLAVIFKQKQLDLQKEIRHDTDIIDVKKKRKEKKHKKNVSNLEDVSSKELSVINNNSVLTKKIGKNKTHISTVEQSIKKVNVKVPETIDNNTKKKRYQLYSSVESHEIIENIGKTKHVLTECDVNLAKHSKPENYIKDSIQDSTSITIKKILNTGESKSPRVAEKITSNMPLNKLNMNDNSDITQKNIEHGDGLEALEQKNKKRSQQSIITQAEYAQTENKVITDQNTESKNENMNDAIDTKPTVTNLETDAQESSPSLCVENELNNCDRSENINKIDSKIIDNNKSIIVDINIDSDKSQDSTKPLRRSRRGKSLCNTVDEISLYSETSVENKTPLTKKQLIFSKLMLDEENNIKPSVLCDVVDTESGIIDSALTGELTSNKTKSVKRKKSPNLKRKCKKKRSLTVDKDESRAQTVEKEHTLEQENCDKDDTEAHSKSKDLSLPECTNNEECSSETDKSPVSLQKRKMSDQKSAGGSQSSRPKKSKSIKTENVVKPKIAILQKHSIGNDQEMKSLHTDKCDKNLVSDSGNYSVEISTSVEIACSESKTKLHTDNKLLDKNEFETINPIRHIKPTPGRRTRSKSAVVKSASKDIYDPYDIDLDEMTEKTEPFRKRKSSTCQTSPKKDQQATKIDNSDFSTGKGKKKLLPNDDFNPVSDLNVYSKDDMSDSGDSSKSDVPLKKYVEEKEKKISEFERTDLEAHPIQNTLDKKRNNQCREAKLNIENITTEAEAEEQLRSEQFMESFGFFSERKPRKSNLLATKKISETFHIIANENDDMFYGFKEKTPKKTIQYDSKKSVEGDVRGSRQRSPIKKTGKRGRKKKTVDAITPSYCQICKKEFRRPDNFLRHQMTLLHVSKLSEVELKLKTEPINEEPNYLIAYKQHVDRIRSIMKKFAKRKKNSKSAPKFVLPSLEEILADVNKIVREQQLSHRGLSCDEELFLDCCELLKESHKKQEHVTDTLVLPNDPDNLMCPSSDIGLDLLGKSGIDRKADDKNDGDVDSITAKNILESEEVRNLENDLISGLKEAANASNLKANIAYQQTINEIDITPQQEFSDNYSSPIATESHFDQLDEFEISEEPSSNKIKKYPEIKEKMYPDIEEIDMFEDKFDKIKRKCRSQAAAAKQNQSTVDTSTSHKERKKSEKKKGKKSSKKNHPRSVLTKGALKGFDGIKVSIPTSDINMAAIVSPIENSLKKKKKGKSKKRRDNKSSESSSKYESDRVNDSGSSLKNVDVYEFMDNDDVEFFELRPSTLMERFRSISKDTPSTSKADAVAEEAENSSVTASDGDDFVYMSDDYVCSDEETENSLMSCEISSKVGGDNKKSSALKRRDAVEKNAVMGKIFKNNAVRSEKKIPKTKEPAKPRANLDQLFDSLLEDEPSSSMLNDESSPEKEDVTTINQYGNSLLKNPEAFHSKYEPFHLKKIDQSITNKERSETIKSKIVSPERRSLTNFIDYGPSTSKVSVDYEAECSQYNKRESSPTNFKPGSSRRSDKKSFKQQSLTSKKISRTSSMFEDSTEHHDTVSHDEMSRDRSPVRKLDDVTGTSDDYSEFCDQVLTSEDTGVARQRTRRKCTVGKQNVLAETWSSESEPDGGPPRPSSAESVVSGKRKKGKKKDGHQSGGRRAYNRHISFKKQDYDSRVSSNRISSTFTNSASSSHANENRFSRNNNGSGAPEKSEPCASTSTCQPSGSALKSPAAAGASSSAFPKASTSGSKDPTFLVPPEPSTSASNSSSSEDPESAKGRLRALYYWSGEGEEEHEHLIRQQHGWIVGDSHKKLVTMLAHAKGRKRNSDDKRHVVE